MTAFAIQSKGAEKAMVDFAKVVAEGMKRKGLTVAELAELVGISRQHVYRILDGKHSPNIATVATIGEKLGFRLEFKKSPK